MARPPGWHLTPAGRAYNREAQRRRRELLKAHPPSTPPELRDAIGHGHVSIINEAQLRNPTYIVQRKDRGVWRERWNDGELDEEMQTSEIDQIIEDRQKKRAAKAQAARSRSPAARSTAPNPRARSTPRESAD